MNIQEIMKAYSDDVKAGIARNILSFCEKHLSAGKKVSGFWHVGSPTNEPGDSLKVHLQGAHQGEGYFNREERGIGPMDLYMEATGLEFKEAVRDAGEWLGIPMPDASGVRKQKAPSAPVKMGFERMGGRSDDIKALREDAPVVLGKKDFKDIEEGSRAWKYLTEERGIDGKALKYGRIGECRNWMPQHQKEVDCWCIPIYDQTGKTLLNVKYFAIDRIYNEKKDRWDKDVRAQKGCEYHLIGMHLIDPKKHKEIVLCEGEADWLSCVSAGIPAVSVPFGAKADGEDGRENSGNRWLRNDWDFLEQIQIMVIAFDNDDAGKKGRETVKRRLPEAMVRKVANVADIWEDAPDGADLNDLHKQYGDDALRELLKAAEEERPGDLATVRDLKADIWNKMFPPDGEAEGFEVHGLGDLLRWRFCEWTVLTGYEGSGKTTWLGSQIIELASQGVGIGIASLEANPAKSYHMMFQQALGCARPVKLPGLEPDEERFERCVDWMDEKVYCYKKIGMTKLTDVLELFAYLARRYGCRMFVIDSLMMLKVDHKHGDSANEREKEMSQLIKVFCDQYEAHIFLVAHAKKAQDEKGQCRKPVRPQDVRGAGEIVNLAFNLISIHLNDEKLYAVRDLYEAIRIMEEEADGAFGQTELEKKRSYQEKLAEWQLRHDSTMYCLKQREAKGDHPKPARRLWFHSCAKQLWHERQAEVKVYVP